MRSTYIAKSAEVKREWLLIDAEGLTLGRLASEVASILRGKTKPIYTPHLDTGDYVVIINAEKIKVTGNKLSQKIYKSYSGYVGGLKETNLATMLAKKPEEVLRHAIKGMLPKNKLGYAMFRKLHVHAGAGPTHGYAAQQPKKHTIKE
ncbi:MAG: 50S ribosomal protein L13 [Clostridiales bacterium]|jgi:large subunit ribosomal protein L13|nr:50S ribosomal protein L13 [Clostridiales bacterium]